MMYLLAEVTKKKVLTYIAKGMVMGVADIAMLHLLKKYGSRFLDDEILRKIGLGPDTDV